MDILLNLADWQVKDVTVADHDYYIEARYNVHPTACLKCDQNDELYKNGTKLQVFKDLPIHGKRTRIVVKRQRYMCQACRETFVQPLPDIDRRGTMTKRLAQYIQREAVRRTFLSVAEEVGVDDQTVRNVLDDYAQSLERRIDFPTPEWLGIDEVHTPRDARCILTNLKDGTVFDFLPSRGKEMVANYLEAIPDKETIRVVCIDMWRPYREVVREVLPHATIVIDRFHVVRMVTKAMERVRIATGRRLKKEERLRLMHDRFILLKHREKLTDEERETLRYWLFVYLDLKRVYDLKEAFYDIYESATREDAEQKYQRWKASIPDDLGNIFKDVTRPFDFWKREILAYFEWPATNGITEALNNTVTTIVRKGRGYTFEALRAKLLYDKISRIHRPRPLKQKELRRLLASNQPSEAPDC